MPYPRFFTLVNIQADSNPISGQIFNGYLDRCPVAAPGGVHFLYTLLNRLQRSAGKNLTLRNVSGRHIFDNVFRFEDTVALNRNFRDGGSLENRYHKNIAFSCHFDFIEIFRGNQRTDDLSGGTFGDYITDTDWQQIVNNAGGNSLITVDNDVSNGELLGLRNGRKTERHQHCDRQFSHVQFLIPTKSARLQWRE